MSEIPVWSIWLMIVAGAFVLGVGIGYLLQGPQTWRPGSKGWRLKQDNRDMREKLVQVGELVDRWHKEAPGPKAEGVRVNQGVVG